MTKRETYGTKRKRGETRKEYLRKTNEVYSQEGFLSGLKYEISSMYKSMMTALANLAEDTRNPEASWKRDRAREKVRYGTGPNREYILHGQNKGLEKTAAAFALLSFIGATYFISTNITGNAISDFSTETTSLIGIGLFILAILVGIFLLKRKNKVSKKKR